MAIKKKQQKAGGTKRKASPPSSQRRAPAKPESAGRAAKAASAAKKPKAKAGVKTAKAKKTAPAKAKAAKPKPKRAKAVPAPAKPKAAKVAPAKPARGKTPARPARRKAAKPAAMRAYVPNQSEPYMSAKQLAWFANQLREMLDQANDRMGETRVSMPEQIKTCPDENDRASQEAEFTLELRERDRDRNLVHKIRQAMSLIDQHSGDHNHADKRRYGYCEECGCKIGLKRLLARPVASMCIDCKILQENREKHHLS